MKMTKDYTIMVNGKVKMVGQALGNIFYKKVKKSKHLFRIANAWGIDVAVFQQAQKDGCIKIMIYDEENDVTYTTTFELFSISGFKKDFGAFGAQIFLPLKYFNMINAKQALLWEE